MNLLVCLNKHYWWDMCHSGCPVGIFQAQKSQRYAGFSSGYPRF